MRIFSTFGPALALSTALALPFAAPALAEATITVTGEASIATTPDMATVSLGVTTEGATAAEAMAAETSAVVASATRACTAPVLGLNTSPKRPDTPSTALPAPMNR